MKGSRLPLFGPALDLDSTFVCRAERRVSCAHARSTYNLDLMRFEIEIAWEDDKLLLEASGVSARVVFLPKEASTDVRFVNLGCSPEVLFQLCVVFEAGNTSSAAVLKWNPSGSLHVPLA